MVRIPKICHRRQNGHKQNYCRKFVTCTHQQVSSQHQQINSQQDSCKQGDNYQIDKYDAAAIQKASNRQKRRGHEQKQQHRITITL